MKFLAAIFVAVLFGLAAAQSEVHHEDAPLERLNRTGKFLDFPDPVMKLFKPAYVDKLTTYASKAMVWFETLDKSDIAFPLLSVGAVAIAVSFLVSSLAWVFVHVFGLQKKNFDKWLKPAVKVFPKPTRGSRVLSEEVDDVTAKVYEAIEKFLEQKSE